MVLVRPLRILINKVLSSICWCGIEYYTIVQWIEVSRYTFGPLTTHLCTVHLVLKNAIHLQVVSYILYQGGSLWAIKIYFSWYIVGIFHI